MLAFALAPGVMVEAYSLSKEIRVMNENRSKDDDYSELFRNNGLRLYECEDDRALAKMLGWSILVSLVIWISVAVYFFG
ncbi:hypothetical protein [Rubellimicrobium aerolatum]|uniref:Uncharacterized protein n=1 Tax=Rubellimicrobium aerolatum TaxID=490979 RepID=A0ABW0SHM2_9RHOB|nr:hypothetical protein [Rubellimicrobium aerolatum]MBP1807777.1 hypothetical protein [Rubellimicrobium aerolatum]